MLKNLTKKNTIVNSIKICKSIHSKAKGLMFTRKSYVCKNSLLFEFKKPTKVGLHMFFVFYIIDVIFLDKDKMVVELKEDFKPFSIYNPKKPSNFVIEVPKDTVCTKNVQIGDYLDW